ncbi:MAG: YebC/PmpR family DNA-binding transcriptional regulator [Candidatus Omnitrophica bacterium]|nr:YebC/PmpR family DNA-binding transcriptional regulator [Candidatus Omnitrophota bacterium]
MSGHSKWAKIKHAKGAADAKRGAAFTKITREITTAAKEGGGDPNTNPRLRTAIARARTINMPSSNIENGIKKGTGELPGVVYESFTFDAYAQGGVALFIEGLTDNKNRTTAEVRNILNKKNGSLASPGSTAFLFNKKGLIVVEAKAIAEDQLMDIVLEAGAEDMSTQGDVYEITTPPAVLEAVRSALEAKKVAIKSAEVTMLPTTTVKVAGVNEVKTVLGVIEALEDYEDVQNVYANFDISDEDMAAATAE